MFVFATTFLVSITLFFGALFFVFFLWSCLFKPLLSCWDSLSNCDVTQFADMVRHMVMTELQAFQHPVQVRTT